MSQEHHPLTVESPEPSVDLVSALVRFAQIVRYRKYVLLAVVGAHLLVGAFYYSLVARHYQSTAELLIIQQRQDQLSTVGDNDGSDNTMETHRKLIQSPVVVEQAIARLAPEHRIDLQNTPPWDWVKRLSSNLSSKTTRKTNFIDVSYRSLHPEAAAAVVRAVIESYLEFVEKTHRGTAGDVLAVLEEELAELQRALSQKQDVLLGFKRSVGHLASNSNNNVVEPIIQRAIRLNEALISAQERHIELRSSLLSIEGAIQRGDDINQHLMGLEEVVGRQMMLTGLGLSNQDMHVLGDQQKKLLAAQSKLNAVSSFYGPNHTHVAALRAEVATIEQYLVSYRTNVSQKFESLGGVELGPIVRQMLQQAVLQAQEKEQQIADSFEEARLSAAKHSGDLVKLQMLERDVARLESLHDVLFEKIATVDMRQVQAPIQATVVREPLPESKPISPQLRVVVSLSLLSGLLVGCLVLYVQDILDDRFNSPEELASQLGVPVLAMVRKLDQLPGNGLATVHTYALPTASETEAFRTLRTSLSLSGDVCDRILVSSSEPGDGKTTISANLSVAFAQAGKKTLVIDADLRRPGFTAMLDLKGHAGVADVLTSEQPPEITAPPLVEQTEVEGLSVLPVGLRRPNPAELLSSKAFVELLAWADSQYDRVIVDCPPVLAVSDAQIIGQLVDGAVLVVRPEKNHRRSVIRAVESFHSTGVRVLGVVANGLSNDSGGYGYGYGYGYGDGYGHDAGEELHESWESAGTDLPLAPLSRQDAPTESPPNAPELPGSIRPRRAA